VEQGKQVERVKEICGRRTADVISSDLHQGTITVQWDDTGETETVAGHTLQDFTGGWEAYYAEDGITWTGTHPEDAALREEP
jgi:hypothetical protein